MPSHQVRSNGSSLKCSWSSLELVNYWPCLGMSLDVGSAWGKKKKSVELEVAWKDDPELDWSRGELVLSWHVCWGLVMDHWSEGLSVGLVLCVV